VMVTRRWCMYSFKVLTRFVVHDSRWKYRRK
jgi:hypothetical protein